MQPYSEDELSQMYVFTLPSVCIRICGAALSHHQIWHGNSVGHSITSPLPRSVSPFTWNYTRRVSFLTRKFSPVLLYYDYLLTLDDETAYFWGRQFNSVTSLFFFNRYLSLLITIPGLVHNFGYLSAKVCILRFRQLKYIY